MPRRVELTGPFLVQVDDGEEGVGVFEHLLELLLVRDRLYGRRHPLRERRAPLPLGLRSIFGDKRRALRFY